MPDVDVAGLDDDEVARRVKEGKTNLQRTRTTRTVGQIVASNVFTLFNGTILAAMVVVLLTGRWKDSVFGFVIIINALRRSRATPRCQARQSSPASRSPASPPSAPTATQRVSPPRRRSSRKRIPTCRTASTADSRR